MASVNDILEDAIRTAGGLDRATLGKREGFTFSRDDKRRLLDRLEKQQKFLNWLVIAIVVLHFLIFTLAVYFCFYYRNDPETIRYLLGGSLVSLLAIGYSLMRLYSSVSKIQMLRDILPNLPAVDAIVVAQSIYFGKK